MLRPTTRDRTICERAARVLSLTLLLWAGATALARESARPVWVVSNGFHTSLAGSIRDLPFAREIVGDRRADAVLIGWGAEDYYRGKVNPWTFCKALCGANPSLLHVVPVRGSVADRFRHSDVVQLNLTPPRLRSLIAQIDLAFARDRCGRRIAAGRGYYADSRFYTGSERFYFPKMCNIWLAQKLRRSGLPIFVPTAIVAGDLTRQAAKFGVRQRRRSKPLDGF